jgi:tetratricopeptide (TPR) repeat protein
MRYYLSIPLLLFSMLLFGAGTTDSLYVSAGEAYTEGRFEKAMKTYSAIVGLGYESPDLYFNMGNAAFRSNELGFAVLYYEKALKLDPSHEESLKNLAYISRYRADQLESVPELFIRTWIRHIYQLFSLHTWSYIALAMFLFMLTGTLAYIFSSRLTVKKMGFFTGLLALILLVISITAASNRHSEFMAPDKAVIIHPSVVVKSTPSLSGTDLFVLHEGTKVRTDDRVSGWIEIAISDGRVGWIPEESLAVI